MHQRKWRSRKHFDFGDQVGQLLKAILPPDVCNVAAATCRFLFLGKDANGNEYGRGVRTFMQTYRHRPDVGTNCVQFNSRWIELDSHDSANCVLKCFGITVKDIYETWGVPQDSESYVLDLKDIVETLRPELLNYNAHAMETTAAFIAS